MRRLMGLGLRVAVVCGLGMSACDEDPPAEQSDACGAGAGTCSGPDVVDERSDACGVMDANCHLEQAEVVPDACGAMDVNCHPEQAEVVPEEETSCAMDFPCFDGLVGCSADGLERIDYYEVRDSRCSGATCYENWRVACDEGSRCVLEMDGDVRTGSCKPLDELCGGPDGIACGEGERCFVRDVISYSNSQDVCERIAAGAFGVCKPAASVEDVACEP